MIRVSPNGGCKTRNVLRYSATLPALAVPADLTGTHIFQATSATVQYDELLPPPDHFCQWIDELPPAEKRVLSSVFYVMCDASEAEKRSFYNIYEFPYFLYMILEIHIY